MFGLFKKDPLKKLNAEYLVMVEQRDRKVNFICTTNKMD